MKRQELMERLAKCKRDLRNAQKSPHLMPQVKLQVSELYPLAKELQQKEKDRLGNNWNHLAQKDYDHAVDWLHGWIQTWKRNV